MSTIHEEQPKLNRLRYFRALGGLSLDKAAKKSGLSPAYLQKIEKGQISTPSPHKLHGIAEGLNINYSQLMALAGYNPQLSPNEADPVRAIERMTGVEGLDLETAVQIAATVYELRLAEKEGIPAKEIIPVLNAAIRGQTGKAGPEELTLALEPLFKRLQNISATEPKP